MSNILLKSTGRLIIVILVFFVTDGFAQVIPVLDWVQTSNRGCCSPNTETGKWYTVAVDASGNVYASGQFYGTQDFDPGSGIFNLTSAGDFDVFITKLDASGNFVWAKAIGGALKDNSYGLALDPTGNIYVTGSFNGTSDFDPSTALFNRTSAGATDIFILKLDNNGDFVWARSIGGNSFYGDESYSIATDAAGNVFTTGYFTEKVDFDPGAGVFNLDFSNGSCTNCSQIFISKLDTNGNFVWAKRGGGFGNSSGYGVSVDPSGNVLTTGYFWSNAFGAPATGVQDIFIAKHDNNGNQLWAKAFGDATDISSHEKGYAITTDATGNVYATGRYENITDFDPGAGVSNLTSVNKMDIFVLKLDDSGNFVWAKSMGGVNSGALRDVGLAIDVDASGNVYTAGAFSDTGDFDPGSGVFNLTASIGAIFISKLDVNGDFLWAGSMDGGTGSDVGYSLVVQGTDNIYTAGSFSGGSTSNPFDFDPNFCTFNFAGSGGFFVQKLKPGTLPPPPTISLFSPSSGSIGNTVTITGTNFSTIPANNVVKFFNNRTATVTASTATSITTTVPISAITGPISVTTNCITAQSATNFIVTTSPSPTVSNFSPTSGPVGATVIITGTNFSTILANNTVKFNGTTAVVTASTATSITTTVPAGATTGKITVTVGGTTATSATNFTVTAGAVPTITSFTPTSGPIATTVTIMGTNFSTTPSNNTVKFFDGIDSYVVSAVVTASTATSITTTVPSGASTGRIKVTTAGGSVTSASNFTVTCGSVPTITSFSPTSGIAGTTVTITGTNFSTTPSNNAVDFGGTTATVTASTPTTITTTVPTGPVGLVPITVTIACNTVASSTDFDVTCPPAPTITSFTPGAGAVGALVTITGTNFSINPIDNLVDFNGEPAIVTASTATSITTSVPTNAFTGPINVYVGCDVASSSTDFIVDCGPAPSITSFSPSNGLSGTVVTISGANFSTTPANNFVDFNGEFAVVTASTATSITTTVPVGSITGPITIVVDCNYVTSGTDFVVGTNITITTQPTDFSACAGQTATFTTAASGATNITYQWQFSPDGVAPFNDIANGGGYTNVATATLSVNTTGSFGLGRYRCRINGDFAPEVISNDEGLFINPTPAAPGTTGAITCKNRKATLLASGATDGEYLWFTLPTGGTAITDEFNSLFMTPSLTATVTYYVAISKSGCEGPRTPVVATVTSAVCGPVFTPQKLVTQVEGKITINLVPLITTSGTLDVNSIRVTAPLNSGASAVVVGGVLTIDYKGKPFSGNEVVTIEACNTIGECNQQPFSIEVAGEIVVYNAVSPNGDGKNDFFVLQYIESISPKNRVSIYNRWGDEVFSVSDYDNKTKVFIGLTNDGSKLPAGTYFYKIELPLAGKSLSGFFDLKY
jgi:gliding motility-associated-like protein